jgi:hypothetical protein
MLAGDYKRRSQSTTRGAMVNSGFAVDPVHVPSGATNLQVCAAGAVITALSVNVLSSTGVNLYFKDANGTIQMIMAGALTARDYKLGFYCPWPVYISSDVDATVFVCPSSKGSTTT